MPHGAPKRILLADDEPNLRRVLAAQLGRDGYEVTTVGDGQAAIDALAADPVDIVVTDLRMPHVDGMALLRHVSETHPEVPVILITAHGTVDTAVEALKVGAFDYVTKPFDRTEFRRVVRKAALTRELARRDGVGLGPSEGRHRLIGTSPAMQEVYGVLDKVADTPSTVLVTGESGTGKELVARALHEGSSRRESPFIRVNCAAIPGELLESELFGYERGAFTGAVTSKPGRFELADAGTLFLDEIGEVPPPMQAKLLRAIQEHEFERVGGVKTLRIDVRLVAATNVDLRRAIEEGRFREDLYYRLNVVHVDLPPLRARTGDIPLLLQYFLRRFNERLGKEVTVVGDAALERLLAYPWPGNIRELENVVERCMLFAEGPRIDVADLPPEVRGDAPARTPSGAFPRPAPAVSPAPPSAPAASPTAPSFAPGRAAPDGGDPADAADETLDDALDEGVGLKDLVREATVRVERELIAKALDRTGGNVTRTARLLKISRKSLQMKMKELGLRDEG